MNNSIIGILGTLLGTLLGWILGRYDKKGKLKIYIISYKNEFLCMDGRGGQTISTSVEQTEDYIMKFDFDVYNSSTETKIMRDITVVFNNGKKDIFFNTPLDDSTRHSNGHWYKYDIIEPINIPPKSISNFSLHTTLDKKELDVIWQTKKIYLTYKGENDKVRKILINEEDYSNYFENHNQEETQNG